MSLHDNNIIITGILYYIKRLNMIKNIVIVFNRFYIALLHSVYATDIDYIENQTHLSHLCVTESHVDN